MVSKEPIHKEVLNKDVLERNDSSWDVGKKYFGNEKELALPKIFSSTTSFEAEIAKVKISLPFSEILNNLSTDLRLEGCWRKNIFHILWI